MLAHKLRRVGVGISVNFLDSVINNINTQSYSYTNRAIGSGERYLVLCIGHAGTRDTSTVSVAGISCTQIYDPGASSLLLPSWWRVYLSSAVDSTGEIIITGPDADSDGCFVGIWSVSSNWDSTINDSTNNGASAQTNPAITMTIPKGGWALTAARNAGSAAFTFTNSTFRTSLIASNGFTGGASDYQNTGESASRTITANALSSRHSGIVIA